MDNYIIMVVYIKDRIEYSVPFQEIATKYGCSIKTRLGIHETTRVCALDGVVVLELEQTSKEVDKFYEEINNLDGIEAKLMRF